MVFIFGKRMKNTRIVLEFEEKKHALTKRIITLYKTLLEDNWNYNAENEMQTFFLSPVVIETPNEKE